MKIIRKKLDLEGVDGLTYLIVHDSPERQDEKIQILFKEVCEDEFSKENYEILKEFGLEKQIVAYVDSFYPNGYPHEDKFLEFSRTGLGSELLQDAIKDVKERGINFICCFDCSKSVGGLYLKNNFIFEDKGNGFYYLNLE